MSNELSFEVAQGVIKYLEFTGLPEGTRLVIELNAMDFRDIDRDVLVQYLAPLPPPTLTTELLPKGTYRIAPAFPGTGVAPARFEVVDPGPGMRPVIG